MNKLPDMMANLQNPQVYTDLNSLQSIKNSGSKEESLKKVAQQFESMFINILMKNMRAANAAFGEDNLFESKESKFYRDMHDQQLSLTMATENGIGIAKALFQQMQRAYASESSTGHDALKSFSAPARNSQTFLRNQNVGSYEPKFENPKVSSSTENKISHFVESYRSHAQVAAKKLGVDANILLSQAALETGWGEKVISTAEGRSSHNLFNIKAGSSWQGATAEVDTLEYHNGALVSEKAKFRAYTEVAQSFGDYVDFIASSPRYQRALEVAGDSHQYIEELQNAGYATDPRYAEKVLSVYRRLNNETESDTVLDGVMFAQGDKSR